MMIGSDNLHLAARLVLPGTLAPLRARFPGEGWRQHRNFGALSAFWLEVHAALRASGAQVAAALDDFRANPGQPHDFARQFVPRLGAFFQHLDGHHRIEDDAYFPKFRAIDPRLGAGFALLEQDHAIIHDALLALAQSARQLFASLERDRDSVRFATDRLVDAARELIRLLTRHLADEEEIVVPALLEHGESAVA